MRNDDLDQEELTRGKKAKESLVKSIIKNAFAPLVLADSSKNAVLSKDHKLKDVFMKSIKDYPDSVFDEAVEGIDVVTSHGPQFSAENPNTAAALGTILDIVDPISYGATKIASKARLPLTLAQGTMKLGDKFADKGVNEWVKKVTKKADMKEVPKLVDYIKKNGLRGKLRDPEKLIEKLGGAYKNGKKVSEGTMDEVGQKIVRTTRLADQAGAKPVNRGDVYRQMKRSLEAQNADDTVSGITKTEPYLGKLQETIKPFKKEKIITEGTAPSKPDVVPAIPGDDLETIITNLTKEADQIKKGKSAQVAQAAEREAAERATQKASKTDNPKSDVESTKSAQRKERKAAEEKVAKDNSEITAENAKVDKVLLDLLLKKKVAEDVVDPMDLLPVPKAQKGLPPIPAKETLDIQLHNKKAGINNKRYIEQNQLKEELPSIEEQIARLTSTEKKALKEVEVPPEMPDEAFEVLPPVIRDVDVPPAIPDEAVGRKLEDVLAELSDAQTAKKNLANSNSKIKGDNKTAMDLFSAEAKAAAPKSKVQLVDRISNLENMWSLKKSIRDRLSKTDWTRPENLPANKEMALEASKEVDNRIIESLKDINFSEGNAADIYRALNEDFGTQADFLDMVVDHTIQQWRGTKSKGGALPALTGGVAAAIAATTGGGNIPLSTVAGATAGEAARRGFGMSPEIKASVGDRLSRPETAHLATQGAVELMEIPGETNRKNTDRELEAPKPVEGMSVSEEDMSPELKKMLGREPQSVEQIPGSGDATDIMAPQGDPIDQKMSHVLMPEKPQWDPYVNEEVLNTFLPRDSKRILANPTALMAKMQQVAPNQVPVLQEMLDNDPEGMAEAGPKIAQMFPTIFEKDKYGMFDGKIIDPVMQQKFLVDLYDDEGMSSIEKANLAMKIQRGESIY